MIEMIYVLQNIDQTTAPAIQQTFKNLPSSASALQFTSRFTFSKRNPRHPQATSRKHSTNFSASGPIALTISTPRIPTPARNPTGKPSLVTPFPDRLITQGAFLLGVRPGSKTAYALLDIDMGSPYHPKRDPLALQRICDALEPLGIVAHLALTSSHSQGLHIYFPFGKSFPSWQIALVVHHPARERRLQTQTRLARSLSQPQAFLC